MNHFKNLKIENRLFFFENKDQRVPQDQVNEGCLRRVLLILRQRPLRCPRQRLVLYLSDFETPMPIFPTAFVLLQAFQKKASPPLQFCWLESPWLRIAS